MTLIKIENIDTFEGIVPTGTDLVIYEKDDESHMQVLYGFDEIGEFDHQFKEPLYGFA